MELHDRFKVLRLLGGYTQDEVATKASLDRARVTMWENGRYGFGAKSMFPIAKILGVDPEYLLTGRPPLRSGMWMLNPPKRHDYLKKMAGDLEELLPRFFTENGFRALVASTLSDGYGVYLLGASNKEYTSLLVVPPQLHHLLDLCNGATCFEHRVHIDASNYGFNEFLPTLLAKQVECTGAMADFRSFDIAYTVFKQIVDGRKKACSGASVRKMDGIDKLCFDIRFICAEIEQLAEAGYDGYADRNIRALQEFYGTVSRAMVQLKKQIIIPIQHD